MVGNASTILHAIRSDCPLLVVTIRLPEHIVQRVRESFAKEIVNEFSVPTLRYYSNQFEVRNEDESRIFHTAFQFAGALEIQASQSTTTTKEP